MKKPAKKVWAIKMTEDRKFYMVDENGKIVWPSTGEQSRNRMFDFAVEHGADEVRHDYDMVAADGSGGFCV